MPDPNPSERLAEIEARVEAATAGPWCVEQDSPMHGVPVRSENPAFAVDVWSDEPLERGNRDAAFIAHAREDIPWLLEREKKLREERELILVWFYRRDPFHCAQLCDLELDPTGALLGRIRELSEQALADSGEASGEAG